MSPTAEQPSRHFFAMGVFGEIVSGAVGYSM
jgi:hypothetical protein